MTIIVKYIEISAEVNHEPLPSNLEPTVYVMKMYCPCKTKTNKVSISKHETLSRQGAMTHYIMGNAK